MKKLFSILIVFFIFCLVSCQEKTPTVVSAEVIEYHATVNKDESFDEESVFLKVIFSDDSEKIYNNEELEFDYSKFDSSVLGEQTITVKHKTLEASAEIKVEVIEKAYRILMIGNSFSDDTVEWVYDICENLNIDITIANMYIGGCGLGDHYQNLKNNSKAYEYVYYNKTSKVWERKTNISISEAIEYDDWNYISLQQASGSSGIADTYSYIDDIMEEVLALKENVKFIWNMTWAYQQDSTHRDFAKYNKNQKLMYDQIVNAVKTEVLPNERIEMVIPNGTAIQNARTSFVGDNLTRDGYHLSNDLGRFIAGLTLVAKLTGNDLSTLTYRPMDMSDAYLDLAKESVLNAIATPDKVTNSVYTEDITPTVVDFELLESPKTIIQNSSINLDRIKIKVNYSDGNSSIFSGESISLDLTNFDSTKLGKQTIKVSVKNLEVSTSIEIEVVEDKINLLLLGYSNLAQVAEDILKISKEQNLNINVMVAYTDDFSISAHNQNLKYNKLNYTLVKYDSNLNTWVHYKDVSLNNILNEENINHISLEHNISAFADSASYANIDSLIDSILSINNDINFIWNMAYAYSNDSENVTYEQIVKCVTDSIINNKNIEYVIPTGTAIENAYTSYIGDWFINGDGTLNELGNYLQVLTYIKVLSNIDLSEITITYDEYKDILIEAVNNAILKPLEVTESLIGEESKPVVLDYKIVSYNKTCEQDETFDESSVVVRVYFSDDFYQSINVSDLEFDYTNFSYDKLGVQQIGVKIKEFDIQFNLNVEVVKPTFRLLMIGNSFSDDTIEYVYDIAKDLDITFEIANLFIGGCTLDTHYQNLVGNRSAYEFVTYDKQAQKWVRTPNTSIMDALSYMDWNYVSLQQASGSSGIEDTYNKLDLIMDYILNIKDDVKFIWNMTWAYQQNSTHADFSKYNKKQMTMYNQIINSVKNKVLTNDRIEMVIPNGTAVQNARTSFVGDNLTRDGYHLSLDLGRYIAGLTLIAKLTDNDLSDLEFMPNGLNEHKKELAIESVLNAVLKPYEVTKSSNLASRPIEWAITEYEKEIITNTIFDESSVKFEVTFSDEKVKTYTGDDLIFGYEEFDFAKFGKQELKVTIRDLNITESIEINVLPSVIFCGIEGNSDVLNLGIDFDESAIKYVMYYKNGDTEEYSGEDLSFDYSNCNFNEIGKYKITIKVLPLDIEQTIDIEIVEACITSMGVKKYAKTMKIYESFDEESVIVKVEYSDGKEYVYSGDDLEFDYSKFDNRVLGKQEIGVYVKALETTFTINVEVMQNELKILMVGNSFSDDTKQWAHEIAEDLGVDLVVANLYIAGCSLDTHYDNLINNKSAYEYKTYDKSTNTWSTQESVSIQTALSDDDWNYVSLQQASTTSGVVSSYSKLDLIMDEILKIKNDVKFVWNMTWAYQQDSTHNGFANYEKDQMTMYNQIVNAVKTEVLTNHRIEMVIPNGTAIQNARTSFVGDTLTRDGYHLSLDLGRYIAGLTLIAKLTNINIKEVLYAPNPLDEHYRNLAIDSVIDAVNNPYAVTESEFKTYPALDLSNYVKIDYKPVGSAYYYSTSDNYDKLVTNQSISINFVASKMFTKETLPIGSIIEIKYGYQYRPEGWIDDAKQTTRPDNTNIKYVTVDEAWWGNYIKRAFNISALNNSSLMFKMKDAMEAFSIYVPAELYNEETNDSYIENDTTLFSSNGLDINDYELYEYTYSNGYYYSSKDATSLTIRYNVSNAVNFICTEGFTIDTLPVGSILIVDEGYQYRPDGWITDELNPSRPGNISTNFVVIDEAWWGDYMVKGFNISKTNGEAINQIPYEAVSHFRIYILK